jgi:hypothetical protein
MGEVSARTGIVEFLAEILATTKLKWRPVFLGGAPRLHVWA